MEKTLPAPFAGAYWVEPGRLLAGPLPTGGTPEEVERRLSALLDAGIRHVVNLLGEDEGASYNLLFSRLAAARGTHVTVARFPIPDYHVPARAGMTAILENLKWAMEARGAVYVHCWGGRGRTGTVVGCYLAGRNAVGGGAATSGGAASSRGGEAALDHLAALRRAYGLYNESPETEEQRAFVRAWPGAG